VDSAAWPGGTRSDHCMIRNRRGVTLEQLAKQAAEGEKEVTGVVSRIVEGRESRSSVPAMMFNSAI
jgi:hypothetical protein